MMKPISKWAHSIYTAQSIPEIVRKGFKIAEAEKPGVTVIELPEDIAKRDTDETPMVVSATRRPAADHKAVTRAVDLITNAKSPVILAGNGSVRKRAATQLRRLARKTGIPVVNTFMGKGAVPMDDQHSLFTMGLQGRDHVIKAFADSDVVITVGYDLVEYSPEAWNAGRDHKIVHVDFEPAEIDQYYPVDVDVVSDLADGLWQINEEINRRHGEILPLFDIGKWAELRQTIVDDLAAEKDDDSFPMKPQRILNDVRAFMGDNDILLSDVGAHKMWIARYYQCQEANTCLISNGFCTMGFAMPGALGAKMAFPDRKIMSISGDAGFLMNVQDLETAARLGLNTVNMVWLDGEYGLIKWKQQNHFDGKHSDLKFNNPDFELLAQAFGIWGRVLDGPGQVQGALEDAFAQDKPAIIAVPVDYSENQKLTKRLGDIDVSI